MKKKELKNGFYWVVYLNELTVAEYYNNSFLLPGSGNCYDYDEIDQVKQRVEELNK